MVETHGVERDVRLLVTGRRRAARPRPRAAWPPQPATTWSAPTTPTLDVTDRDAVLGAITTLAPGRRRPRRGVDRGRRVRGRSGAGVRRQRAGGAVGGRGVPSRRCPPRATCRPTTSSTARSTGPTTSGTAPTRSRCTARPSWPVSGRRSSSVPMPPSSARRGCAAQHGSNIVKTVLGLAARSGQPGGLAFVDDQRGCPTFTADLAPLLRRLAARPPLRDCTT